MKKILYHDRFKQIINNIQTLSGQEEILLCLLENAKQAASDDINKNCPEYDKAWDKEMQLMEELKGLTGWRLISEYIDAAEETNNIWAEEMYLRGIQDAVLFMAMITVDHATDITKVFLDTTDGEEGQKK